MAGVGGEIGAGWNYEVSLNWGQFKEDTLVLNNLDSQKFGLAMDSVRDPSGKIVCRSQIDPNAAYAYDDSIALGVARLAQDVATCIPVNPFGDGNITKQMHDYLVDNTTSVGSIKELVANATVTGDSSGWFSLPVGPIGLAFGFEHRTEENSFEADPIVASGLTFYNALTSFEPPKLKVNEVFTEFRVPLLKEKTGAQELTLNLAARYADYNGATGGVLAYNGGLEYAPIDGLRFRAGIARAVRAPSLADLYAAQGQNFEAAPLDPCALDNRGNGSPTRQANCAAAGIPTDYNFQYTSSIEIVSGGNPDLKEETSDSFTAGFERLLRRAGSQQPVLRFVRAQWRGRGSEQRGAVPDRARHIAAAVAELRELHLAWHRHRSRLHPRSRRSRPTARASSGRTRCSATTS